MGLKESNSSSIVDSNTNNIISRRTVQYIEYDEYCDHQYDHTNSCCSSSSRSTNNVVSKDLSTDLRLGLSISPHLGQYSDWPPIKPLLRSTLAEKSNVSQQENSLFVKVYMEGLPIGRKLDLLAHHDYHTMISTLSQMFKTTILYSDVVHSGSSENCHILTYEDKEGDWMMVGDVPWEMFLTTVKRLKIATLHKCQ